MTGYVPRVTQLDALILDEELQALVNSQVFRVIQGFEGGSLLARYGSEIQLVSKLIVWRLSVYRTGASIGQQLLGIKYPVGGSRKRNVLAVFFLLETIVPYLYDKVLAWMRAKGISLEVEKRLRYVEDVIKICGILNFLTFLMQNRYPTLVHRILRLKMMPINSLVQPSVGYSYQLREMLWHQFSEFLMVVLPLVNIHRLKRYLTQWNFTSSTSDKAKTNKNKTEESGSANNAVLKCCFCKLDAVIPQRIDNCVFCYYCLKANAKVDADFHTRCTVHSLRSL